ncbi:MAG: DNA primase [Clostridia bacterium]
MSEGRFYPEEVIEELIDRNDIVDTVSEYVKINKKGKDYFGLCPFHKEKTPSFSVVPAKQIFYCFGCGKGGNVLHFIKSIENIEYIDAIRVLAEKSSYVLPESRDAAQAGREQRQKTLIQVNTLAARYFFSMLKTEESMEARKYLSKRGLDIEIIKTFGIGYAQDRYEALSAHLKQKGFLEKDIVDAGLAFLKDGNQLTDRFRNRIMFPIFDARKRVIAFGARIISGEGAKYMNSPETPVYNKSSNLYGIHIAKDHSRDGIIIVEGYMDCIALHQAGIKNCVASLGTALAQRQARILKKMSQDITIAYDSDAAGQAAALRGLDMLSNMGLNVRVVVMPDGKDPDDFIKKHGVEAFKDQVKNAKPLVEYKAYLARKKVDLSKTEGIIKFLNEMAKAVAMVSNDVEKEMYVKKIASDYSISEEALMNEVKKHMPGAGVDGDVQDRPIVSKRLKGNDDRKKHFFSAIAILCLNPDLAGVMMDELDESYLEDEGLQKLFDHVKKRVNQARRIDENYILNVLEEKDASLFSGVSAIMEYSKDTKKALLDKITSYRVDVIKGRINRITSTLDSGDTDEQMKDKLDRELLENMMMLRKTKK